MKDISDKIRLEKVTPKDGQYFFGYYDISPENFDGTKILVNRAPFIDKEPKISDKLEVGYIDVNTHAYIPIGMTEAWNFQEGCRLQWLDENRVIYNIREGHGFKSIVYDIEQGGFVKEYNIPIYSISHGYALSYSFTNNKYCYAHTDEGYIGDSYKDGVYILNLAHGEYRRIISNETLSHMAGLEYSDGQVEYCVFNPKGDRFYLYYRWREKNGMEHTMLCVSDLEGNVKLLLNSNSVSHAGWRGNEKITAWGRLPSTINAIQNTSLMKNTALWKIAVSVFHRIAKDDKLRQKFTNDAYIMFDVVTGENCKLEHRDFVSDGHCTWSADERFMLTDTYPDIDDKRHLMLYDSKNDFVYLLGKYYSYPSKMKKKNTLWASSAMRCDLHPKWGKGKYIYFDSVHEGYRGVYRIDISQILKGALDE